MPLFFFAIAYGILRTVFPPKLRGVTLTLSREDLRRGSEVDVRMEVANPDKMTGRLEFGLVCAEFYDVETADARGNSSRSTLQFDAYTDWRRFTGGPAQTEGFVIPREAPYSYSGDCVSWVWRASARLPTRLRFREQTEDYSATAATYGRMQLHEGELVRGASFPFAIELPPDCLPSVSTGRAWLYYEVHAQSDEPGLDTHTDAVITVVSRTD